MESNDHFTQVVCDPKSWLTKCPENPQNALIVVVITQIVGQEMDAPMTYQILKKMKQRGTLQQPWRNIVNTISFGNSVGHEAPNPVAMANTLFKSKASQLTKK